MAPVCAKQTVEGGVERRKGGEAVCIWPRARRLFISSPYRHVSVPERLHVCCRSLFLEPARFMLWFPSHVSPCHPPSRPPSLSCRHALRLADEGQDEEARGIALSGLGDALDECGQVLDSKEGWTG